VRLRYALYWLALLFFGVGYLAILPPFEGFDETAHYSSIRQIADTGVIPVSGASFLDREAADYTGPMPYGSLNPPFDRGLVYSTFFSRPELSADYRQTYWQAHPSVYRASQQPNWEAQHPPLYYGLMALLERATERLSFVERIFILRLVSYLLAVAGVGLGLAAAEPMGAFPESDAARVGFLIYPIALPMFFPEFTRIGNDALCLFLIGALAWLWSKWLQQQGNRKLALAIGVVLGLGLLTKAFFVPLILSLVGFLLVRHFASAGRAPATAPVCPSLALLLAPAILIGGAWYAYQLWAYGIPLGDFDTIHLAETGGFIANLKLHFSLAAFGQGLAVAFVTYVWAGTWSLVRLPGLFYVPLLLLVVSCFAAFGRWLKSRPFDNAHWLCAWLLLTFGIGIVYHVLVGIAAYGNGNTPGWYFHILMPWAAPALGIGLSTIMRHAKMRMLARGLLLYAVVFQLAAIWAQVALFTGCASKGVNKQYVFTGHAFCLDQVPQLYDRLSVLARPNLALAGFGVGFLCMLLLAAALRTTVRIGPTHP